MCRTIVRISWGLEWAHRSVHQYPRTVNYSWMVLLLLRTGFFPHRTMWCRRQLLGFASRNSISPIADVRIYIDYTHFGRLVERNCSEHGRACQMADGRLLTSHTSASLRYDYGCRENGKFDQFFLDFLCVNVSARLVNIAFPSLSAQHFVPIVGKRCPIPNVLQSVQMWVKHGKMAV